MRRLCIACCWLAGAAWAAELYPVAWRVLGQIRPYANGWNLVEGRELASPQGIAFAPPYLYVADTLNNRVLGWRDAAHFTNGAMADLVIGQPDRFTTAPTSLLHPAGLAVDRGGKLWVADSGNHRILGYSHPFQAPDAVIDQPKLLNPLAVAINARGDLIVADTGNNQVLIFTAGSVAATLEVTNPTALALDASGRLYVASAVSNRVYQFPANPTSGTEPLRILGGNGDSARRGPNTLLRPSGLAFLGDDLFVADAGNHRLLRFTGFVRAMEPRPAADAVFGQPDFTSGAPNGASRRLPLASSVSVSSPAQLAAGPDQELFVADAGNHRVLALPARFQEAARVLGQDGFTQSAANLLEGREVSTTNVLSAPLVPLAAGGGIVVDASSTPPHVYVADTANHRVLGWRDLRGLREGARADLVLGQPDLVTAVANYGAPAADNRPATSTNLTRPSGLALDAAGDLYVVDTGNNRVLRFPRPFDAPASGADLILAYLFNQPTGISIHPERGDLLVADTGNHRVLYFPAPLVSGMVPTRIFGQTGVPSATMSFPTGVAFDAADNVYVADTGNSRVLVFGPLRDLPATGAAALATGAAPIGQPDFVTSLGATAINRLRNPTALWVDWSSGDLWVADTGNHRVLRFPPLATLAFNGGAAYASGGLFGQVNFTARTPNLGAPAAGQTSPAGLNFPNALTLDGAGNLLVGDANARVLLYFPPAVSVSAATFLAGAPLAPGMLASLFGAELSGETIAAGSLPLPTTLGGVQVLVDDAPTPLLYVSPRQINYQAPSALEPGVVSRVQVWRSSRVVAGGTLLAAPAAVGLFAVLNQDGTPNSPANPAARGAVIQIYATGQGAVRNAPPDGAPAPASPLAETPARPLVTIGTSGERDVTAEFSGLAPGFVGVWQINTRVPEATVPSARVPLVVRYGGSAGNVVYIAVR